MPSLRLGRAMKRRSFIALIGGAAAWPMITHAQQATPVSVYLHNRSPETTVERLRGFHLGLKESGYVEGENLTIFYRWADGDNSRLPGLVADLVNRRFWLRKRRPRQSRS